jgi:arabinogalactan endo-1,4-beta-galactosidase
MSEWKKYPKREAQQPQQQPQEAKEPPKREGGKWVEVISLFHQGNGNTYKKLSVQVSDDLKVILTLTEGETGSGYTKISFQLSEQELIYLAERLRHLFYKLGK